MKTFREIMDEDDTPFIVPGEDCPRCRARGKTWRGSHPRCAFKTPEQVFNPDNWNCATANTIREIAERDWFSRLAWPETWWSCWEDEFYGVIDLRYVTNGIETDDKYLGTMLVWSSYKHHGCFGDMWLFGSGRSGEPRRPTLSEVERIITWFEQHHPEIFEDEFSSGPSN